MPDTRAGSRTTGTGTIERPGEDHDPVPDPERDPEHRPAAATAVTVIEPSSGWVALRLRELWPYRELLFFLTWRDVKIRYKQTILGGLWAVIQPVMMMVVFTVFFGRLAAVPSDGVPYPIFSFTGLVPWALFTYALTQAANSLVGNSQLLTKVYFPRLLLPVASTLAGVVDFALSFVVLVGMMAYYRLWPTPKTLLVVPGLVLLCLVASIGVGLWLAALSVRYRDVRYTLPFLTQLWLFATPIAYPSSELPDAWRVVSGVNPMAGVVEGFRWTLLGTDRPPWLMLAMSSASAVVLLTTGLFYFRRTERSFSDVV